MKEIFSKDTKTVNRTRLKRNYRKHQQDESKLIINAEEKNITSKYLLDMLVPGNSNDYV